MTFLQKIISVAILAFGVSANALSEGKEYITLKTPIIGGGENENSLIEIFSYRCTHCYDHHKFNTLAKVKAKLPNLRYEIFPVSSMGDYGKQANELFAYAAAKDKISNTDVTTKESLSHKLADAYFTAYFKKKQRWGAGKDPEGFYAVGLKAIGITKAELDEFLSTSQAQEILKSYEVANDISRNYGTPAFVVNGKYQIIPQAITSPEVLVKIVEELIKK
ncbi:thiol:disulfide interchange protein DsbA/DsbL [Campylobacter armoricus]|uniref:thiol:disulfide interchange protein DsbA/DsbL n=2 Tax=Campylobacter armoricus TaxID=2505970 RepID=UPI0011172CE6|nr:thiol:disulfide interchange protein DsbA/DsbL [Campylobacter armoricus]